MQAKEDASRGCKLHYRFRAEETEAELGFLGIYTHSMVKQQLLDETLTDLNSPQFS